MRNLWLAGGAGLICAGVVMIGRYDDLWTLVCGALVLGCGLGIFSAILDERRS